MPLEKHQPAARLLEQPHMGVERQADPVDRRVWRLYLTDQAEPMIDQLKLVAEQVLAGALAGISKAEVAAMRGTLEKIRENVSAIEGAERKSA